MASMEPQLEIFETPDPPDLQPPVEDDRGSRAVEEIDIRVKEGFEEFKNAKFDTSQTDFSHINAKGYGLDPWEYELNGNGERMESLSERYARVEREIAQLHSDLQASGEETQEGGLLQKVSELEEQLGRVRLDKIYSEHASRGVQGVDRSLANNLLDTLHTSSSTDPAKDGQNAAITYELVLKPDETKYIHASALRQLDDRLGLLERIVGGRDEKSRMELLSAAGESHSHSLMSSLSVLQRKCLSLDQTVVGNLDQKAGELLQKMDRLKQEGLADKPVGESPDAAKVNELYELTKRWDATASALPDVIERLHTLKTLHESAAGFNLTLNDLEQRQKEISESLSTDKHVLEQVSNTLEANVGRMQQNFENLNQRIDALNKKS